MPALVAGIHFLDPRVTKTWTARTSQNKSGHDGECFYQTASARIQLRITSQ